MECDELKIRSEIGEVIVCFVVTPINSYENVYTAWLKEHPEVIVESNGLCEALEEIHKSIEFVLLYENNK